MQKRTDILFSPLQTCLKVPTNIFYLLSNSSVAVSNLDIFQHFDPVCICIDLGIHYRISGLNVYVVNDKVHTSMLSLITCQLYTLFTCEICLQHPIEMALKMALNAI